MHNHPSPSQEARLTNEPYYGTPQITSSISSQLAISSARTKSSRPVSTMSETARTAREGYHSQKSSFLNLPNECILLMFSFSRASDIRNIALIFNHRLFALASPIVTQQLAKIRSDDEHFASVFPKRHREYTSWPMDRSSRYFEYLDLPGDLSWAEKPVESETKLAEHKAYYDAIKFDRTVARLLTLGLSPPQSFLQMFYQLRWLQFFKSTSRISCRDIAKVLSLPASEMYPSGLTAYVLTVYREHYEMGWFHLYLDTDGRHAMLTSDTQCAVHDVAASGYEQSELFEISAAEMQVGVLPARLNFCEKYAMLEDMNFERWLMVWAPIPGKEVS